jgi:hypothetical protein
MRSRNAAIAQVEQVQVMRAFIYDSLSILASYIQITSFSLLLN